MGTLRHAAEVGRGLSPAIWQAHGLVGGNFDDPSFVAFHFDDFAGLVPMASATPAGGLTTFQDTGVVIGPAADVRNDYNEFGILQISGNDADNDAGFLGMTGAVVNLYPLAGRRAVVAAEIRMKKANVADNALMLAFGLAQVGAVAAGSLADNTGAIGDIDFVGLQTLAASGEEIDTVFRKSGETLVQVQDNAAQMADDTWTKLGLLFDPRAESGNKLQFFVDGTQVGEGVEDSVLSGSTFPFNEGLIPVLLTKTGAAAESLVKADWMAVGMQLVD